MEIFKKYGLLPYKDKQNTSVKGAYDKNIYQTYKIYTEQNGSQVFCENNFEAAATGCENKLLQ